MASSVPCCVTCFVIPSRQRLRDSHAASILQALVSSGTPGGRRNCPASQQFESYFGEIYIGEGSERLARKGKRGTRHETAKGTSRARAGHGQGRAGQGMDRAAIKLVFAQRKLVKR